ncbi:MAG TPA: DMT family transporter [Candidatus Limnocylindrales bacterium]|nr:DMT family transporter [Candidatus Limnocylindrales bacterium]
MRQRPPLGYVLALVGASLFAWLGPLSRFAYDAGMGPLAFVAWRAGVGSLILGAIIALRVATARNRRRAPAVAVPRREVAALLGAAVLAMLLNIAIFAAFSRVTVAVALLAIYTYPAMVAAVAVLLGRERATRATFVALALALGGMAIVVAGSVDPAAPVVVDALGVLLGLAAAAFQTVFVLVSRTAYRSIPTERATAVILGGAAVGCVLIAVGIGEVGSIVAPFGSPGVLPILLVAGSLGAALPSLFFLAAIRLIGGTRTGILMLFEPVVAVVLAAILLHEPLRPIQVLGAAGVLGAAVLIQRASRGDADASDSVEAVESPDVLGVRAPGGP